MKNPADVKLSNGKTLADVLGAHKKWLAREAGGERANLSGANLRGATLSWANLSGANLSGANLRGADLFEANLSGANLSGANLSGANLRGADLSGATLSGANLRGANLRGANLYEADLRGANLYGADLSAANLPEDWIPIQHSPDGPFWAWKKLQDGYVAKLFIPEDAKRVNSTERKCRASHAIVLAIFLANGEELSDSEVICDRHTGKTAYQKGKTVYPDSFNDDVRVTCAPGIHYFITRKEAEEY